MSTGQDWTSCQDLAPQRDGDVHFDELNWHVKYDLTLGTCVVYVIDKKNIILSVKQEDPFIPYYSLMHPAARFLIKPFYNEDGSQIYLTCGKVPAVYGRKGLCKKITEDVYEMLCKAQANISGTFYLPREVYHDPLFDENKLTNKIVVDKGVITNFEYLDSHVMFWSERDILFQLSKQDMIIEKDPTGELCCEFALFVPRADQVRLVKAIIDKDETGEFCCEFACNAGDCNVKLLQQAVIDKDKTGKFCYYFARDVEGANIKLLRQATAAKAQLNGDDTYLTYFSQIQKYKAKGFF